MASYKLTKAQILSTNPLTVEWSAELTLDGGTTEKTGEVTLSVQTPLDRGEVQDGQTWTDYTPAARAALLAVPDPNDKAAILAAVHLDAARLLAERVAVDVNHGDLLAP